MFKIFKNLKKTWLKISLVVIAILLILVLAREYLELRKSYLDVREKLEDVEIGIGIEEIGPIEKTTEEQMKKCLADFDLDKLDFTIPIIWDSELSTMLKPLLVMQAVKQNNRNLCNFERQDIDEDIDEGLHRKRCEFDYDFFFVLTEKLKEGIDSQQYIQKCQEVLLTYILFEGITPESPEAIRKGLSDICKSYYQSFQNKNPIILNLGLMCDGDPQKHDKVNYFDPQTNQLKSCIGEFSDEIKFLIAIAKNAPTDCLDIKRFRTSQYCQFYFDRDLTIYQDEFKNAYCRNLIHNIILPNLFPGIVPEPFEPNN